MEKITIFKGKRKIKRRNLVDFSQSSTSASTQECSSVLPSIEEEIGMTLSGLKEAKENLEIIRSRLSQVESMKKAVDSIEVAKKQRQAGIKHLTECNNLLINLKLREDYLTVEHFTELIQEVEDKLKIAEEQFSEDQRLIVEQLEQAKSAAADTIKKFAQLKEEADNLLTEAALDEEKALIDKIIQFSSQQEKTIQITIRDIQRIMDDEAASKKEKGTSLRILIIDKENRIVKRRKTLEKYQNEYVLIQKIKNTKLREKMLKDYENLTEKFNYFYENYAKIFSDEINLQFFIHSNMDMKIQKLGEDLKEIGRIFSDSDVGMAALSVKIENLKNSLYKLKCAIPQIALEYAEREYNNFLKTQEIPIIDKCSLKWLRSQLQEEDLSVNRVIEKLYTVNTLVDKYCHIMEDTPNRRQCIEQLMRRIIRRKMIFQREVKELYFGIQETYKTEYQISPQSFFPLEKAEWNQFYKSYLQSQGHQIFRVQEGSMVWKKVSKDPRNSSNASLNKIDLSKNRGFVVNKLFYLTQQWRHSTLKTSSRYRILSDLCDLIEDKKYPGIGAETVWTDKQIQHEYINIFNQNKNILLAKTPSHKVNKLHYYFANQIKNICPDISLEVQTLPASKPKSSFFELLRQTFSFFSPVSKDNGSQAKSNLLYRPLNFFSSLSSKTAGSSNGSAFRIR